MNYELLVSALIFAGTYLAILTQLKYKLAEEAPHLGGRFLTQVPRVKVIS